MKNSGTVVSQEQLADVLKHLWDLPRLGNHPLTQLASVKRRVAGSKSVSRIDLGRALNQTIRSAIQLLQPQNTESRHPEARYYLVLYYSFIDGESSDKVARRLSISRRTYYRDLSKAMEIVRQVLNDWELEGPAEGGSP